MAAGFYCMAKKFPDKRCVYCLEYFEEITSDHVLPKAWYPDNTPENLEKWQVPSCYKCNQEHGRNEEELLLKLGLHFDPRNSQFRGVANKVTRAMTPSRGKSKRDRSKRQKRRDRTLRETKRMQDIESSGENVLPGFGFDPDGSAHLQLGVPVNRRNLRRFGEKVTRGVFYLLNDNMYIESDYELYVHVPTEAIPDEYHQMIRDHGKMYNCGPGIGVVMAVCSNDANSAMLKITIWNRLTVWGLITPRRADGMKLSCKDL